MIVFQRTRTCITSIKGEITQREIRGEISFLYATHRHDLFYITEGWSGGAGQTSRAGPFTIWIKVGQGPAALAVGAGGGCLDIFSLVYLFSSFSPSLGDGPI